MHLIASRVYPFTDFQSLEERQARDLLFRTDAGSFVLHLSSSHIQDGSSGSAQLPFSSHLDQQRPRGFWDRVGIVIGHTRFIPTADEPPSSFYRWMSQMEVLLKRSRLFVQSRCW